jgi:hypothetical protein
VRRFPQKRPASSSVGLAIHVDDGLEFETFRRRERYCDIVKTHSADARLRLQAFRVARKAAIRAAFIVCQTEYPRGTIGPGYAAESDILNNANVESTMAETIVSSRIVFMAPSNNNVAEFKLGTAKSMMRRMRSINTNV